MSFPLRNRLVVLTGAASGIGAALAQILAARGANLALIDRDAAGLELIARKVRSCGGPVHTYTLELSDANGIRELPSAVEADIGTASVLINNAGIAAGGTFEQLPPELFDRVLDVNFFATVAMVRAFLPQLRRNAPAQIVNLSSLFGLVGCYGQVAYCASKFAVRGFSESLRGELVGADIGVSVVHPGGVRTNIAASALVYSGMNPEEVRSGRIAAEKFLRMEPHFAAERIAKGLEQREKRIVIGSDAKLLSLLQRLMPASYGRFLPRSHR